MYQGIIEDLEKLKNSEKAKILSRFFKTWKWEYWEWDKFLWIPVPEQREIAKKYFEKSDLNDIEKLLNSEYHEVRLTALLILCYKYEFVTRKKLYDEQKKIASPPYRRCAGRPLGRPGLWAHSGPSFSPWWTGLL